MGRLHRYLCLESRNFNHLYTRPKVIDTEAGLPPLTILQEVIQFDPLQRVTYNVLAALIASNVYTSEPPRSDQKNPY